MKAVCAFVRGNEVKIENPMVSAVFTLIKAQIEENTEAYKAKCEKQAEYGRKGSTKRWGEKEKAIEEKSYPTENNSYPISENGYPIESNSYPISENSYPINSDRVERRRIRIKIRIMIKIYYPPIVPPRGERPIPHCVRNLVKTCPFTRHRKPTGRTIKRYWMHSTNHALAFLR